MCSCKPRWGDPFDILTYWHIANNSCGPMFPKELRDIHKKQNKGCYEFSFCNTEVFRPLFCRYYTIVYSWTNSIVSSLKVKHRYSRGRNFPSSRVKPCADCKKEYIGKTIRQFSTRTREHKEAVASKQTKKSALAEHSVKQGHKIDWESASILRRSKNWQQWCLLEAWEKIGNFSLGSICAWL